jgi:hypothetical protein
MHVLDNPELNSLYIFLNEEYLIKYSRELWNPLLVNFIVSRTDFVKVKYSGTLDRE